ncbi:ankyrin repeat domain-containing protein [Streptomyces solicathayae]|uniref:HEAT repeat domain-containing protein n=1 Tax=Streptomyces solicathayae TaxID=3081768 RepID=A0ABZ0LZY3_9ACTN|nr:ankyrin repeat domain-containing protein [Streptomyces sp. HUAS YS2]WOX24991.1 HEAT repeat domain-containing protein [Streptomyces sp. HUAS YS2]
MDDLFEAVHAGDDDALVRLLRAGASAETADEDGGTLLYLASVANRPGAVRSLLAAGADPERGSGPDAADLPLCGAACGGHTEVVRALLAAGALADRQEEFGFTAMAWAVRQGHTDTVQALLEHGADPYLPGPDGLPPLIAAARRGSAGCVRALLGFGAGPVEDALREARGWLGADVEAGLLRSLTETYGTEYEPVVRRIPEDGGITVVVELLREDGTPGPGNEQQTGHAAIVTLLEGELGLRTSFEELAERALRCGDPELDDWTESVAALWRRGDEETFRAAAAYCGAAGDELRQAFGASVLGQLREFAPRSLPLLRELSREARDGALVEAVVAGLGQFGDPAALPEILRHAGHPDPEVRRRVAVAVTGLVPEGDARAVDALVALSRDADSGVRDWATLALAEVPGDAAAVREALAARLADPDQDTAAEAARGLAIRQDPRAVDTLVRLLSTEPPESAARDTALAALEFIQDPRLRTRLEWTTPR